LEEQVGVVRMVRRTLVSKEKSYNTYLKSSRVMYSETISTYTFMIISYFLILYYIVSYMIEVISGQQYIMSVRTL